MRSLFNSAPFTRFDLGRHLLQQPGLGQMTDPYLTQAERDRLLAEIRTAMGKLKPIDDLMAWSGDNDPGLSRYLGMDATRWSALTNSIAPLYPTVSEVEGRLAETDAEYWYRPSDQELAQVKQWTTGVNQMYALIEKHRPQAYVPQPGTKPPPLSVTQAQPLTPTGGTGITTQNILIGGAVAVGLGLLVAALA